MRFREMTVRPIDAEFAARLGEPKDALISSATNTVEQLGARAIPFDEAPAWPEVDGLADDAIIETFTVDASGKLTALSESAALDAWKPRAEALAVHELIDPRETRPMLCEWVDWIQPLLDNLTGPVRFGMRP